MSIAGVLAITGSILAFVALMIAIVISEQRFSCRERHLFVIAWFPFGVAIGFFIAATWTAALT